MKPAILTLALLSALTIGPALMKLGSSSVEPSRASLDATDATARDGAEPRWRPEAYAAVRPESEPDEPTAVLGASRIPYPVYPNGRKYRIGGENGLKIVVYQTDDAFADVDAYYRTAADLGDMPRLEAMQDYVRYSLAPGDDDPWETSRPGIVIHQLESDAERRAVGAAGTARTNIIMSF